MFINKRNGNHLTVISRSKDTGIMKNVIIKRLDERKNGNKIFIR
jgi:hypothetical protein